VRCTTTKSYALSTGKDFYQLSHDAHTLETSLLANHVMGTIRVGCRLALAARLPSLATMREEYINQLLSGQSGQIWPSTGTVYSKDGFETMI